MIPLFPVTLMKIVFSLTEAMFLYIQLSTVYYTIKINGTKYTHTS